jgi:hypothetical protein
LAGEHSGSVFGGKKSSGFFGLPGSVASKAQPNFGIGSVSASSAHRPKENLFTFFPYGLGRLNFCLILIPSGVGSNPAPSHFSFQFKPVEKRITDTQVLQSVMHEFFPGTPCKPPSLQTTTQPITASRALDRKSSC